MTAHYIVSPDDKPADWFLQNDQLAFKHLPGSHTGANIAQALVKILDRYEIPCDKARSQWTAALD